MYQLIFLKEVSHEELAVVFCEYNNQPDTRAKNTGGYFDGGEELEITINFTAEDPFNAILQGAKLAEDNDAEIWSISRTERIATEEIFNS